MNKHRKSQLFCIINLFLMVGSLFTVITQVSAVSDINIPSRAEADSTFQEAIENNTFIWRVQRSQGIFAINNFHADDLLRIEVQSVDTERGFTNRYQVKSWFNETWRTAESEEMDYLLIRRHWGRAAALRLSQLKEQWYLHPDVLENQFGSSRANNLFYGINLKNIGYFDIINRSANIALESIIRNNYAYTLYNNTGLSILNINNPNNIYRIGSYVNNSITDYKTMIAGTNTVYIAAGEDGLILINDDSPFFPIMSSMVPSESSTNGVALSSDGDFAFVSDGTFLKVINVADRYNPSIIFTESVSSSNLTEVAIKDNILFILNEIGDILLFDISDPEDPVKKSNLSSGKDIIDIKVQSNNLFTINENEIIQYDIIDINNIEEENSASADTFAPLTSVELSSTNIFLGNANGTIFVADTTSLTSSSISALSEVEYTSSISDITFSSNKLYVSALDNGYNIINVQNPESAAKIGAYNIEIALIEGITGQDYINIIWKSKELFGQLFTENLIDEIYEDVSSFTENHLIRNNVSFVEYSQWFGTNYVELIEIRIELDKDNYDRTVYTRNEGILLKRDTSVYIANGSGLGYPLEGSLLIEIFDLGDYGLQPGLMNYVIWAIVGVSMTIVFLLTVSFVVNKRQEKLKMLDY